MSSQRRKRDGLRLNAVQKLKNDIGAANSVNLQYEGLLVGLPTTPLTPEQENALAKKIQVSKKQDEDAINELVLHAMREAFFYAMYFSRKLSADSVYSLCYSALRYAATNFQPHRIRFLGFAKPYIRGEICKTFNDLKVVKESETESMHLYEGPDVEVPDAFHRATCVESDMHNIIIRDEWESLKPIFREKLSENERMVLELKYEGGLNFSQISSLLRICREATRMSHSRALRKIRCVLMRKKALFNRHQ